MSWTATKTWAVGDPWTATDADLYLRDDANYLKGDPQWLYPALLNSWTPYAGGYQGVSYRRVGDRVMMRGLVKQNSAPPAAYISNQGQPPSPGTNRIFTLAAAWRPPYDMVFYCGASGGGIRIDVYTDGSVCTIAAMSFSSTWQYIDLSNISFSVMA